VGQPGHRQSSDSARCRDATSCWSHAEQSCAPARVRYRPCRRMTYTGGNDAAFHARYEDGMGIKVKKRKNDTAGRGLVTRVPGSHLQRVMMAYSQEQRLDISPRCTKTDSPGAHSYCPPFFPKVVLLPGHAPPQRANGADARVAMTRQNVTEAIVMEMLCVDSRQFSNVEGNA